MNRPSVAVRTAISIFRKIPRIRGRGRLEAILHRTLEDRHLREVMHVNGYDIEVSLDDLIGRSIYLNGVWERENSEVVRRLLGNGAVAFDVGANTGYFTLLFATLTGRDGKVYAFEPVPSTAAALKQNLSRNKAVTEPVEVIEVALSNAEGVVQINVSGERNLGASHVVAPAVDDAGRIRAGVVDTIAIRCATGDSIWRERGCPAVDLVKIDIEGHEWHALSGMHDLIAASPRISILVEVRESFLAAAGASTERLFSDLRSLGLNAYDFDLRSGRFTVNNTPRWGELVLFSKRQLEP